MKYKWLWFDFDNTLMDFDTTAVEAFERSVSAYGISYSPALYEAYQVINKACWAELEAGKLTSDEVKTLRFDRFLQSIQAKANPEEVNALYLKSLSEILHFYQDTLAVLDTLKANGYRMAIITNGLKEVQRPKLQRADLLRYFEVITISGEIGVSKPALEFFEQTHDACGNPPKSSILVIGDSISSDIKGGHNFGVDTCWSNYLNKSNETIIQPNYEIGSLMELLEVL